MGIFSTEVSIRAPSPQAGKDGAAGSTDQREWVDLSATVDTGAFLVSIPGSLLRAIGVEPSFTENVRMADGRNRAMDVGHAWLRLNGREVITLVAFNEDYTTPLLGSLALETLRLAVDPVGQRLFPMDSIPL